MPESITQTSDKLRKIRDKLRNCSSLVPTPALVTGMDEIIDEVEVLEDGQAPELKELNDMPETVMATSCRLRKIRDAIPLKDTAARVGLERIIIEVEILEDCRIAMNRTITQGLHQSPVTEEPRTDTELRAQGELDF